MTYATLSDLQQAATGGWDELAQRAAMNALVDGQLLQATVEGTERSAWTVPATQAADAALVRMNEALDRASAHADTYLFPRYRTVMPLAAELVAGSSLPAAVAAIALKRLYGHLVPEDVRNGTKWADDYLRDLSKGVVSLGGLDATVAQPNGRMVSHAPPKAFDWGSY
ncbi:MAG: hypothetical protein A2496_01620 [Burkholderiales bacterium RIFOXYC12_FULL_60_6]|nr:MAG: hypothetical protein A2503_10170 [Burkholderiales bacterium RIFOXYD12_FULL_59_19]OGB75987.1 MAG: hypothetical protein A2496_01620 [Burkholderiales bacterium RIFOXYC12_FULL_60_6]